MTGLDPDTGVPKGRLRGDRQAVRFVEIVVNGPKSWSLTAELHPDIGAAYAVARGPGGDPDPGLARAACHHPGRAAGRAGADPGGAARGDGRAALHVAGGGSAPASAPTLAGLAGLGISFRMMRLPDPEQSGSGEPTFLG